MRSLKRYKYFLLAFPIIDNIIQLSHQQIKQHMNPTAVYQCKKGHLDIMKLLHTFHFTIETSLNIASHMRNQKQCTLQNELGKNKHFLRYLNLLKKNFQTKNNVDGVEIENMLKMITQDRKQNLNKGKYVYSSNLNINMTSQLINKTIQDISENKIYLPCCHLDLAKIAEEINQELKKQYEHELLRVFCSMLNIGSGVILSSKIQQFKQKKEKLIRAIKQLYESSQAKITPQIDWSDCVTIKQLQEQKKIRIQIRLKNKNKINQASSDLKINDQDKTYFVCSEGQKNFHSFVYTNHGQIIFLPMVNVAKYLTKKAENKFQKQPFYYQQYQQTQVHKKFPISKHLENKNWVVWLICSPCQITEEVVEYLKNQLKIQRKDCLKSLSECFSKKVAQNSQQMAFLYLQLGQIRNNIPKYQEFSFLNKDKHTISLTIDLISSSFEVQENERTKSALEWANIKCGEQWGKKPIFRQYSQNKKRILRFEMIQQCVYILINFNRNKKYKKEKKEKKESQIKFYHQN